MSKITYHTITAMKNTEKSQVLLALMEEQDDPVIIKRMKTANPEVYRVLSERSSVHIPRIYAMEWQGEELVVAEEYVDGETLEFYMEQGNLEERQKLAYALQLCDAVAALHTCNPQIIHRDIKPSNVLITEEGVLKLIDFDASRQYKRMSDNSDTRILGTADYAAPEQFGYKQTDVRSDIYSMGIVFEMMDIRVKGPAAWMWKRVLDVCTNFDPKKRYKNVNVLATDIRRVMTLQNYQWYYVGGVVCAAALLVFGGMWLKKPAENAGQEVSKQVLTITPEATTITNALALTSTPVPTNMPTTTSTPMPTPTESPSLSPAPTMTPAAEGELRTLEQIEQELQAQSLYVNHYHQGVNKGENLLIYSDMQERAPKEIKVMLTDLASGTELYPSTEDYGFENSIFYLTADYLQTLQSTYYRLTVDFIGENGFSCGNHIRIFAEDEPFEEGRYALQGNYLEYHYEKHDKLHAVLRADSRAKIAALYDMEGVVVPEELYQIMYEGRGMEFSADLLKLCKERIETIFEVEFDNGKKERITIANPYLVQ